MIRFLILYNKPDDVHPFERHYQETHVPLAKKLPWTPAVHHQSKRNADTRSRALLLIAESDWDDLAALQRALQSPDSPICCSNSVSSYWIRQAFSPCYVEGSPKHLFMAGEESLQSTTESIGLVTPILIWVGVSPAGTELHRIVSSRLLPK
jgi:uncharacterized protein (TIGR02118 family)